MSKADPTISEREMRYRENQAKRGLVMVRVWVPKERRDDLLAFAKGLKDSQEEGSD